MCTIRVVCQLHTVLLWSTIPQYVCFRGLRSLATVYMRCAMKDGPIRSVLKAMAAFCFRINAAGTRALWKLQRHRPYELAGDCSVCGACCVNPAIQVGWLLWYFPTSRALFLWWQERVNGFELVERHIATRTYVFRCTHYDPCTHLCDSYESRPGMCRDYPHVLLWQANPEFLPACGYRPIAPGADKLLEALAREDLPPEKLEEVKKKLHL